MYDFPRVIFFCFVLSVENFGTSHLLKKPKKRWPIIYRQLPQIVLAHWCEIGEVMN